MRSCQTDAAFSPNRLIQRPFVMFSSSDVVNTFDWMNAYSILLIEWMLTRHVDWTTLSFNIRQKSRFLLVASLAFVLGIWTSQSSVQTPVHWQHIWIFYQLRICCFSYQNLSSSVKEGLQEHWEIFYTRSCINHIWILKNSI